jgi:hypothetical protein
MSPVPYVVGCRLEILDDYTLLLGSTGSLTINPIHSNLGQMAR